MGRIKASDLIKEYSDNWDGRLTDHGDFAEYASGYICDAIAEYADGCVSIWTDERVKYAYYHDDSACEALAEYGLAGIGFDAERDSFTDLCARVGAVAWCRDAEGEVYSQLNEAMQCAAVSRIADEDGYIDREAWDEACSCMDDADNDDMCGDYIDRLADLYNSQMDDEAA